ncbi:hypothetical protein C5167_026368 [Papaver somniferum]|nr:hypothetical protein C5167_026368 [Papaver somniferum]
MRAYRVGVNYGMVSDNIPPPDQVITMCKSRNIQRLRLFEPNPGALAALSFSGIEVILGTRNEDLPKLAVDPSYAKTWVETHVMPHIDTTLFKYISAGNEVIPGELANYVLPAMKNLDAALKAVGRKIPVSTTVPSNVLGISYPPSAGKFSPVTAPVMEPIVAFLASESYPLLVNIYPYFAYIGNPKDISLDYALFNSEKVVVRDGALGYKNLFDAMVDAVYAALEKAGGSTVRIVLSETGWPSAGGDGLVATINNAQTYNRNLISHLALSPGTPRRPRQDLETYIFALFNEDLKAVGTERNFGLFYPNMTEVYGVSLKGPFSRACHCFGDVYCFFIKFALFLSKKNSLLRTGAYRIGMNYGMVSDNIPPPGQVISMCTSRSIQRLRLFEPNPAALAALSSSGIEVILGTRNEDLPKLAADASYAETWVETHVMPHANTTFFKCISLGNEVIPSDLANYVLLAMKNLDAALKACKPIINRETKYSPLFQQIPVSTTVRSNVLGISYPPSAGEFSNVTAPIMEPIIAFLAAESYPLLVNVYPYFAYIGNPKDISLDYALFNSNEVVVRDGELEYTNLFVAMVDAVYAALEKAGGPTVRIVV